MAEQSPTARQNDRALGGVSASDPFDPAALRARLEEARAQRERAIAARQGAAVEIPTTSPGPRSVAPSPPYSLPRQPTAELPQPRFKEPPLSQVLPAAKPRPTRPEPLVALPGERPAPPRRTPRAGRRRLLPALAFLGGCLAVAAGVSMAPPSLRQQIAEFIAPLQTAPVAVADKADDANMTNNGATIEAQVVVPAETPGSPPAVTIVTVENAAAPAATEAPRPIPAPKAPESVPSPPIAAPVPTLDLPPDGWPAPGVAVASTEDLPAPSAPDAPLAAPEVPALVANAGRVVGPPPAPSFGPAPDRLSTVVRPPAPAPAQAEARPAPSDAPPAALEASPAPLPQFQEPALVLGEAPRPPAGAPLRVAPPAKRPPIEAPAAERLAALIPAEPAMPEAAEPATAGPARVLIHYPPSAVSAAQAAAAALAGSGAAQAEVVPVRFAISRSNVRFYHAQDAPKAQALASALSGAGAGVSVETRDFTSFRPSPAPGTIEVWLAGGAPEPARTAARPPQPAASPSPPAGQRASRQALASDERQRLEREIQGLLLRQLRELERR